MDSQTANHLASTRIKTVAKQSLYHKIRPPDHELYVKKLMESDGKCYYCGQQMQTKSTPPFYGDAYSIDHKLPISCYGSNDESNLVVCCARCNITKGTMTAETFTEFVELLKQKPDLLQKMFVEMNKGRLANKITRDRDEREIDD